MDDVSVTTVAVIGLGYIGLPTAAALSRFGVRVHGVDVNPDIVEALNRGETLIVEPALGEAVEAAVRAGLLTASTSIPSADAYVVAVPTPFRGDHEPDLSYVHAATEAIAQVLRPGQVVILESTSPPGTTMAMSEQLARHRPDLRFPHEHPEPDVFVAHCPERVLPGRIMAEIFDNDRIIGGITPTCAQRAAEVYRTFAAGGLHLTSAAVAEMTKLSENAFRDVNIAFANEIDNVCRKLGLDAHEVIRLANRHPRVNILTPGPGVGGHCIAVDPWFIVSSAPTETPLIRQARLVNDDRPPRVVAQVSTAVTQHGGPVACLGLAFKADVDDLRESPAVGIVALLAQAHPEVEILVAEPHVDELPPSLSALPNVRLVPAAEGIRSAPVVVLLVDHAAFRDLGPADLLGRVVIDTRGFWPARDVRAETWVSA